MEICLTLGSQLCVFVGMGLNASVKMTKGSWWLSSRLEGEACGIPHLAKNERDVGHPAISAGIEPGKLQLPRYCPIKRLQMESGMK
jgi:hypothetical protein